MPLRRKLEDLRSRLEKKLGEAESRAIARVMGPSSMERSGEEPPVVARLMVEIRSDGSRTIARGAMEDVATGERVAVEAAGTTPVDLAASLARTILTAPLLARTAVRAVLDAKRGRSGRG